MPPDRMPTLRGPVADCWQEPGRIIARQRQTSRCEGVGCEHARDGAKGSDSEVALPVGWSNLVSDSLVVCGATLFCQAVGVVTSLLFRVLLSPMQMGVWQGLKLLLSYSNFLNLGVSKGAARELAVARGRGNESEAEVGLHVAFTANTSASMLLAAVLVLAFIWSFQFGGWANPWSSSLLAMAVLVLLQRYASFLVTIQRARQRFELTSKLAILEAILTLVVGGLAAWRWGVIGLYLGAACVLAAAILYLQVNAYTSLRWRWDRGEIRRLTAIGLPMVLSGLLSSLFRSLDKVMILACMTDGTYQLGCYSAALLVGTQLYGIANQLAMVGAPRYAELWGRTSDRRAVALFVARTSQLMAWVLAVTGLLAAAVATPLLEWLLPKYVQGLPPLVWLIPGVAAAGLAVPLTNYLVTIDRQARSLMLLVVATVCAALLNQLVIAQGGGLIGIAAATSAASIAYLLALVRASIWPELSSTIRRRYAAHLCGALTTLTVPMLVRAAARIWNT